RPRAAPGDPQGLPVNADGRPAARADHRRIHSAGAVLQPGLGGVLLGSRDQQTHGHAGRVGCRTSGQDLSNLRQKPVAVVSNNAQQLFRMSSPACPITGEPAIRLVQWVNPGFLISLWRIVFKVDVRSSFGHQERIGLWESPTSLYFFDPPLEGDYAFYRNFYQFLLERKLWSEHAIRHEFELAASRIRPNDRVLDVGCGFASFRRVIPQATYVGLDPNFAGHVDGADVTNQALGDHLATHSGTDDAVCACEVLEHLKSPVPMFADMIRAARPGGLVIVGVPHIPSALTRIPNFLLNAPPHHLTWWTEAALQALARRTGATVESI